MAELRFDGRNAAAFPPYLNPNIFFQSTFDDPTPAIPTKNVPIFILASVKNAGKSPTINANVKFFVCDPSTVPTPTNSQLVGTSNVSLDAGETKTVLCVSAWTPQWVNEGHECVICEASASNDPAPPHPNAGWNLQDRHNVQRNVTIVFAPPQSFALLTPMAASGRFFDATATLSIRRAPDSLFMPTLQLFGVRKCTNVSKESSSGLVKDYVAGAPAPKKGEERIELRGLLPNAAQGFHALVRLPEKDRDDTAAFFLVEQHDKKGQLVGGVGVLVIGGARPRIQPAPAAPPSIPVSVPSRPYATSVTSGMMNLDGIFVSNVGRQLINAETLNQGSETLFGLSMYVEGIADPLVTTPLTVSSPLNGRVFPQASFKSVFLADFTKARTGETMVSFIFQQQSGAESKTTRVLKKIFVMGLSFNRATKTFEAKLPQGSLYVHLDRVIAPKPPRLGGGGTHGNGKCCCCCGGGESDGPETDPTLGNHVPYPVFIKSGTLLLVPSPHYDGTHGPLPFNDPWWKLVLAVIAAILVAAGAIVEGVSEDGGTVGAEGTFEETDPSVHCCTGASVPESTSNGVVAGLIAAGAAVATIAAASDDADWHDRGQEATPPNEVEITTSEYVKFEIDYTQTPTPGVPFNGKVTWNYERNLDSGKSTTPYLI